MGEAPKIGTRAAPAKPGDRRSEAEGQRVDAARVDPERARHARVLHGAAHDKPEARVAPQAPGERQQCDRDHDHDETVVRHGEARDCDETQIGGHALRLRSEPGRDSADEEQAQSPGREQRVHQPAVEKRMSTRSTIMPKMPTATAATRNESQMLTPAFTA